MAESNKVSFIVSEKSFEKFGMMLILGTTGAAMDYKMNFFPRGMLGIIKTAMVKIGSRLDF